MHFFFDGRKTNYRKIDYYFSLETTNFLNISPTDNMAT